MKSKLKIKYDIKWDLKVSQASIEASQKPIVIKDMNRLIYEKLNEDVSYHSARKLVKKSWRIDSSRGLTRCQNSITNAPLHLKSYYWSEFLKLIYQKNNVLTLMNPELVDQSKKITHGFPRGKTFSYKNDVFSSRENLIIGVLQHGDYFGMISYNTIKSMTIFYIWQYWRRYWISEKYIFRMRLHWFKTNASIHHTSKVKSIALKEKYQIAYLPQYSSELTQI